jgi:cell division protein ZapA (FtsZ GTPase activity inhibitor)
VSSIKILGKEYRIRSDADPEHIEEVAAFVDKTLREVQRNIPDTQDAAILAALNFASDLLRIRAAGNVAEPERIQALIDLVDSV